MIFRSRIAPTPSGFLHIGNAYSFVFTWLWTRLNNGQLLLRIDDMDNERCRPEYLQDIFDTLQFLGIDYDEGPKSVQDFTRHFTQITRLSSYYAAIEKIKNDEPLYACICSRKDAQANKKIVDPLHCKQKNLPFDTENAALRIKLTNNSSVHFKDFLQGELNINLSTTIPDFVIQQKNGLPAYQVCSLMDDLQFGITHIVRGEDLLPSTAAQLYLAKNMNEDSFNKVRFLHHPLIKTNDGNKLSKSAGDTSIKAMRNGGFLAKQVLAEIVKMFGINHYKPENVQDLLQFIIANDGEEIGIFAGLK